MSKKQTAVEWLMENLHTAKDPFGTAKEMEKKQMKDAVLSQCTTNDGLRKIFENQFEQYYKETYES